MYIINQSDTLLIMAAALFFLGMCVLALGIFVLITKAMGKNVSVLSAQTAKLAQKGIAEDMAGLVGNASALMNSLNDLVRTATGIGIFLATLGLSLMSAAYWIVTQISWPI
jgi:hypothetical protein